MIAQTRGITRSLWALAAIGWCAPALGFLVSVASPPYYIYAPFGLVAGLAIALPAISMHKYLSAQADSLILETDRLSLSIVEQLSEQLGVTRQTEAHEPALSAPSTTSVVAGTRAFTMTHRV